MQRLAMTVGAVLTAMALSASAVVAAPTSKPVRAITNGNACAHDAAAMEDLRVKPAKAPKGHDRGKHLGHTKQRGERPPGSDAEEVGGDHVRKQNHGWFVSQAAHDTSLSAGQHGKAVSEVARGNQGKPAKSKP